jgi:Translation initiation factor IF-2, N-terminal region
LGDGPIGQREKQGYTSPIASGAANISRNMENEFMKRGYLLPEGCKDLMDVLKLKQQHPLLHPLAPEILKKWQALKSFKSVATKLPIQGVLTIPKRISISQLATLLGQKPFRIVAELMNLGFFLSASEELSFETASLIARKCGFLAKRAEE